MPNPPVRALSKRQKNALELFSAMGKIHVLAVGVSEQAGVPDLHPLPQPVHDARALAECFADVRQLNVASGSPRVLASNRQDRPTRGRILGELKKLAAAAHPAERLLFYFSGHGVKVGKNEFALVPEDAFSTEEEDALVPFSTVKQILNGSQARQKLIILDACYSGPSVEGFKSVASRISRAALANYVKSTEGVAILASSPGDRPSLAKSPNPQLSLLTHFLVGALRGDPEALTDGLLTLGSLYDYVSTHVQRDAKSRHREQRPVLEASVTGEFLLADFSQAILDPEAFDIGAFPIASIEFSEGESTRVSDVLTNIRRFNHYSPEYIARKVNEVLPEHLEPKLGRLVADLRRQFGWAPGSVAVDGAGLTFPGGSYSVVFKADSSRDGQLVHTIDLQFEWFSRAEDIPALLKCFSMYPSELAMELSAEIDPKTALPGLQARDWEITSELADEIEAKSELGTTITVERGRLVLRGFTLDELFGDERDGEKARLAAATLTRVLLPRFATAG